MMRRSKGSGTVVGALVAAGVAAGGITLMTFGMAAPPVSEGSAEVQERSLQERVMAGRHLVITHVCADCHGGFSNPNAPGYLAGVMSSEQEFLIGGEFTTRPRNLTPDNDTGLGRFSERQIFNALRYGLRPGETPDVEITSTVPGEGNFPMVPKYLAPPMPWPNFRHMSDRELWDIVAYLKHGLKPVSNRVEDSEGPPDFWASAYTVENIGTHPAPPFPGVNERMPGGEDR